MPNLPPRVDLDAIRVSCAADVALLLAPSAPGRLRLVGRAGGGDDFPDEVLAPQGSLLARIVAGAHPGRVPRLPLMSGTVARSTTLGPSLVVRLPGGDGDDVVLVVGRKSGGRPFPEGELDRVRDLATAADRPVTGITLLDLEALGGDAMFREAFEVSVAGMSLVDPTLRYRWVNGPLCTMLGRGRAELVGSPVTSAVHPEHLGRLATFFERLRRRDSEAVRDRLRFQRPDGTVVWADVGGSVVDSASRSPLYLVQQFDVTADHAAAQELAHRATHDALTGLANRALLLDRLEAMLARSRRDGSRVVVFYLDVDLFKEVNDAYGHTAGDEVLRETGRRLLGVVRGGDTVARFGGDEFVVAGVANGAEDAAQMARRVGVALRPPVDIGGDRIIPVTTSIGVALSRTLDEPEDLVERADVALLEVKRLRRLHLVADDAARGAGSAGPGAAGEPVEADDAPAEADGVRLVARRASPPPL